MDMFGMFDDIDAGDLFLQDDAPKVAETETEKIIKAEKAARLQENAEIKAARAAKRAARLDRNAERVNGYAFADTTRAGNGWHIYFDAAEQKTRVIFEKKPSDKIRQLVKDSGFWYNGVMKSWNKRLNMKSFKAAQELALKLAAYTA